MMMMEKEQTKVSFSNFDKSLDDDDDDGKGTNKGLWPRGGKLSRGQKAYTYVSLYHQYQFHEGDIFWAL